jgi:hypothetical protein
MSRLQCRGLIALAAVMVALLSSRPADAQLGAQIGIDPGPPREPGGCLNNLITGAYYDIANQAHAEKQLRHVQEKLRRDTERGCVAASDRDVRRIDNLTYRIAMDEWLIRWNMRQNPGFYPIRTDPVSCAAIAQAGQPVSSPYPPQIRLTAEAMAAPPTSDPYAPASPPDSTPAPPSTPATTSATIFNVAPASISVTFSIDGVSTQSAGGSRQDVIVAPGSIITYDAGGSLGQRKYSITQGLYEFRSTAEGWVLYKLPGTP